MFILPVKFIFMNVCFSFHLRGAISDFTENHASNNQTVLQESLEQEDEDSLFYIPGDKWTTEAIKNIAYYLRNHKFNDWDARYYKEKPNDKFVGSVGSFPVPPLRSLHWEVKANCFRDFYKCMRYLYGIVKTAPYSRTEDSVIINSSIFDETISKRLYYECKERHIYANKIGLPFDDPTEKFQWSVTASYYMCWYTMLGIPALSMIGESCDNFANCGDTYFDKHNHDPRADDNLSFKCAMYSFCPDPCCPIKHIESFDACYNNKMNPCILENSEEATFKKKCYMDRKYNQNFKDITSNKFNISCNCQEGFIWISKFGMCVDINECLLGIHNCDAISQDCLNTPGTFLCICKWEYGLNSNASLCLKRSAILWP